MKKPSLKMQRICIDWNKANPVGCNVILSKDSGEQLPTKTRSEAYVCDSGYPVIFLEGIRGYYLLDRVKRMPVVLDFEGERHELTHG